MVKSKAARTVIHDPSSSHVSRLGASHKEWSCFMSSNVAGMYNTISSKEPMGNLELDEEELDMRKILKDIERLGSSTMNWKERKKLENKNVVALGGKPTKSHRMPLSVAKPMMKNIKRREEKKIEEDTLLGIFAKRGRSNENKTENRRPENRVLRSTEGYFSRGVLNVKHLLKNRPEEMDEGPRKTIGKHQKSRGKKGKGKGKGKTKKKGKRKGR